MSREVITMGIKEVLLLGEAMGSLDVVEVILTDRVRSKYHDAQVRRLMAERDEQTWTDGKATAGEVG